MGVAAGCCESGGAVGVRAGCWETGSCNPLLSVLDEVFSAVLGIFVSEPLELSCSFRLN